METMRRENESMEDEKGNRKTRHRHEDMTIKYPKSEIFLLIEGAH